MSMKYCEKSVLLIVAIVLVVGLLACHRMVTKREIDRFWHQVTKAALKVRNQIKLPLGTEHNIEFCKEIIPILQENSGSADNKYQRDLYKVIIELYKNQIETLKQLRAVTAEWEKIGGPSDLGATLSKRDKSILEKQIDLIAQLKSLNQKLRLVDEGSDASSSEKLSELGYIKEQCKAGGYIIKRVVWSEDIKKVREKDSAFFDAYTKVLKSLLDNWESWRVSDSGKLAFLDSDFETEFSMTFLSLTKILSPTKDCKAINDSFHGVPAGWKKFQDDNSCAAIHYPPDWQTRDDGGLMLVHANDMPGDGASCNMIVSPAPKGLDHAARLIWFDSKLDLSHARVLKKWSPQICGLEGRAFVADSESDLGFPIRVIQVHAPRDGQVYQLTCTSNRSTFESRRKLFDQIIENWLVP